MVAQTEKTAYEPKTLEIAKELLGATQEKKRSLFGQIKDLGRWDDKLLDWAMSNPGLRVQLFRFIDCLPALHSKPEIAAHLQEYLTAEEVELPDALKKLLDFANPDSMPANLAATTVAPAVETLAHKYIAGDNVQKIVKTLEKQRKEKMAFTVDLLGEAVITETEAQSYLDSYLELMAQLAGAAKNWSSVPQIDEADVARPGKFSDSDVAFSERQETEQLPRVQVSVKLTAFYSQFDPLDAKGSQERVCDRIRTLLRRAKELGVAVHFDMEQYKYKDLTLAILKELLMEEEFRQRSDIGITTQAYLRDSEADLRGIIDWAKKRGCPVTVRLVKGAYWDQETITALQNHWPQPVYNDKEATDANFEKLTQLMLENHQYIYSAIGSHNVRSQAKAMAIAETLKVPRRCFEMQVLYGMGDKLAKALVERGYRVRVYCPYGDLLPGMSYLIRRLLENTANSSFIRQSSEERPVEELLASPNGDSKGTIHDTAKVVFPNAADTDYANAQLRQKALNGLALVREELGKTYLPLVNGDRVNTIDVVDSVNPSNPKEIVGQIGLVNTDRAEQAIAAAKAALPQWRKTPAKERANILRKAADIMEKRRYELTAWMTFEVGKVLQQGDAEVSEAIDFCRYYADEMERLESGYNFDVAGESDRYHYQSRGITLVISPWNFPMAIPTGMTVASLVAGNCTLLKPAEVSSVIAAKLAEILVEAGMPPGVFQYVPCKGSTVGEFMVQHPDINTIVFTGSQEVGCRIFAEAAVLRPGQKHLKRVIAEMGGKNGIIVDESADLDQAVAGTIQSAFGYSGQKCSACSRAIVLAPVYDKFVERLVEATRSLNVGDAAKASTQVGPVIDAKAQKRIKEYIEKGKTESQVAIEVTAPEVGYFVGPTVFANVPPTATIAQEEIFGPVLAVIKAQNFDEALEIANGTLFALTGGLYSRTPSHIERAKAEFEVGNLYINRGITGAIVSRQPFGGFKLSGVGSKAGGPDYLLQFLEPRTITENVQRQGFAPIEGFE
jgi:RHH-type proline utilization regulon transcriptional repressor/proline dehydrogenase/delta 1-pyrroline-5-carboxylate dehydrogenase